ncbi:MAG: DHH family phosphoesterase [Patescibacteria group bacterium]|jgi:nanoRNase/pAp phosphatase (c-di-AMP/oligoRNAs hydrolase)
MLKTDQQIAEIIGKNSNILICLPASPTTDAIAAGLALFLFLEKKGKKPKVVVSNFALPATHAFLPRSQEIFSDITALRKFIISLDVTKAQVSELNYDIKDGKMNIYISPQNGYFSPEDVTASAGEFAYDAIFVLDAPDLEALGEVYDNNIEFFYKTPIINIDHHPANDNFGQINMVDIKATSVSEIIFELLERTDESFLDEYIATNLLTGIISKTKSFKTSAVTPRSLAIASHLISSGARRDDIVKNLYQTKSIHALKLWGKALTKLNKDAEHQIVWSVLSVQDFIETGATEEEIEKVVDELIINTPEAKNVFILYYKPDFGSKVLLSTPHYIDAKELFKEYYVQGSPDFTYLAFKDISSSDVEKIILERLRKAIKG